jgi:enoyl-CoA hydratase/carnithine racemase
MPAVIYEKLSTHIGLVTLNRPEAYNAINQEVAAGLDAIVKETENDPQIRVVIITGAGEKAFCAGADLKLIAAGRGIELNSEDNGFAGFVYAKRKKPWIAAVNGFALAGGTEICLACEMIVAAENAKFGLPEVTRGLIAGAGGLFRLPRALPEKIAMQMICTGELFGAEFAEKHGMVNKTTSQELLITTAKELAEVIAKNSPNAVRESISFIKTNGDLKEIEKIDASNRLFTDILSKEDALEGSQAFVEKREPSWKS